MAQDIGNSLATVLRLHRAVYSASKSSCVSISCDESVGADGRAYLLVYLKWMGEDYTPESALVGTIKYEP